MYNIVGTANAKSILINPTSHMPVGMMYVRTDGEKYRVCEAQGTAIECWFELCATEGEAVSVALMHARTALLAAQGVRV